MARIDIDAKIVLSKLKSLKTGFQDMTEFFKDVADYEWSDTLLRYDEEVDPDGRKWRDPIAIRRDGGSNGNRAGQERAFAYWKKSNFHAIPKGWHFFNRGTGDKAMHDTGNLSNSIQRLFGKNFAEVGTNVKYGKFVQALGFRFLGINEKTKENINKAFQSYIKGKL